ncbi:MAG TPA: leucine-rich repeat domain-containing protein, partial [Cellulomonas sp.]
DPRSEDGDDTAASDAGPDGSENAPTDEIASTRTDDTEASVEGGTVEAAPAGLGEDAVAASAASMSSDVTPLAVRAATDEEVRDGRTDEEIFPDPALRQCVRSWVATIQEIDELPADQAIPMDVVARAYDDFFCSDPDVVDLTGIDELGTWTLHLTGTAATDLSPLAGMARTETVFLTGIAATDLGPVGQMPVLRDLRLMSMAVTDLTPLEGDQLTQLALNDLPLADLDSVSRMPALRQLQLIGLPVDDLSPLAGLASLSSLDAAEMPALTDLSALAGLTSLTHVTLRDIAATDLGPLAGLTSLLYLAVDTMDVTDLTPLSALPLTTLQLVRCPLLHDLSPVASIETLAMVFLSILPVSDLGPLGDLPNVTSLTVTRTPVSDVTPVAGMSALTTLDVGFNQISDISPLAALPSLTYLSAYNQTIALPDVLVGEATPDVVRDLGGLVAMTVTDGPQPELGEGTRTYATAGTSTMTWSVPSGIGSWGTFSGTATQNVVAAADPAPEVPDADQPDADQPDAEDSVVDPAPVPVPVPGESVTEAAPVLTATDPSSTSAATPTSARVLAVTGASVLVGLVGAGLLAVGLGLVALRRRA